MCVLLWLCCWSEERRKRDLNTRSSVNINTHTLPHEQRWSASYLAAGDEETRGRRWRRTNQNGRRLLRSIDSTKRRETLTECVLTDRLSKRSKINDDYFFWALVFFLHCIIDWAATAFWKEIDRSWYEVETTTTGLDPEQILNKDKRWNKGGGSRWIEFSGMKGNSGKVTSEEGGDDANKEIPAGHNSAQAHHQGRIVKPKGSRSLFRAFHFV